MHNSFIEKARILNQGHEAYATAIIVRRTIPSSGKPGDKAIITRDGKITGWIGGGCTRGIVLKEALLSLQEGKPRYVSISPDPQKPFNSNTKIYRMTCQSGGTVDVYIEPVLPKPQIVVFGHSHIAMALARIAKAADYQVSAISYDPDKTLFPTADHLLELDELTDEHILENSYLIVCTQGDRDVEVLHQAISLNSAYLSFVASRKKANAIFHELRTKGVSFEELKKIKTPAGLDIGAKLPEEVAISILAEIIKNFRSQVDTELPPEDSLVINSDEYYINPVCQIPVQKNSAKHILEYQGEKVYFCCDGCKVSFEKSPEKYMNATEHS